MQRWVQIFFFLVVVKPLLSILIGVNVFGRQHLPAQGQFILIANHNSHLDALALMNLFPLTKLHRVRPVAAADYFMTNVLLRWFACDLINIVPIPRTGITKANNPLTRMAEALELGTSLIVFPEGSRGAPETMQAFKSGVAHLIHKFPNIPVIPVYMRGMGQNLPKGEVLVIPFFCDVMIGPPQHYSGSKDEITAAMEATIMDLAQTLKNLWEQPIT